MSEASPNPAYEHLPARRRAGAVDNARGAGMAQPRRRPVGRLRPRPLRPRAGGRTRGDRGSPVHDAHLRGGPAAPASWTSARAACGRADRSGSGKSSSGRTACDDVGVHGIVTLARRPPTPPFAFATPAARAGAGGPAAARIIRPERAHFGASAFERRTLDGFPPKPGGRFPLARLGAAPTAGPGTRRCWRWSRTTRRRAPCTPWTA